MICPNNKNNLLQHEKRERKKKLPLLARYTNIFNQTERKNKSRPPYHQRFAFIHTDAYLVCNRKKSSHIHEGLKKKNKRVHGGDSVTIPYLEKCRKLNFCRLSITHTSICVSAIYARFKF